MQMNLRFSSGANKFFASWTNPASNSKWWSDSTLNRRALGQVIPISNGRTAHLSVLGSLFHFGKLSRRLLAFLRPTLNAEPRVLCCIILTYLTYFTWFFRSANQKPCSEWNLYVWQNICNRFSFCLGEETASVGPACWRSVCCESLLLSFRDSFDIFDTKMLFRFSVFSTLSVFREVLFFGEFSQLRHPQVLPVPLMPSLVLFFLLFFPLPTSLRVRLSQCLVVLMTPSMVLQQGASQKRETLIDLFLPIFSVLHCWCLYHCWCPLKSKGTYTVFLTEEVANSVNY